MLNFKKKAFSLTTAVILISALMFVFLLSGCSGKTAETGSDKKTDSSQKQTVLVAGHTASPGNPLYIYYDELAKRVAEKSNGKMKVEVHPANELGGDTQLAESARMGTIDIGACAANNLATYTNSLMWLDLPYVIKSLESGTKIWQGPIGNKISDKLSGELGLKVLTYLDTTDYRVIANSKKEVKVPNDLKGIKLRATESKVEIALLKAWNASPTPVQWVETYGAVQQGVVDGLHLPYDWLSTSGFGEIVKYATEVNAMYSCHLQLINKKKWDSLSPEEQDILTKSAKEAYDAAKAVAQKAIADSKANLIKKGVKIYTPTPEEYKQWYDAGVSIWDNFTGKMDAAILQEVKSIQ